MTEGMKKRIDALGIWVLPRVGRALRGRLLPVLRHALLRTDRADPRAESGAITAQLANIGLVLPRASLAGSTIVLPCLYGIATALPVILVAFLLAYSASPSAKRTM